MQLNTSFSITKRQTIWFERFMACIAAANLGLVFFDISYVSWRDLYLRHVPVVTQLYDPVKGIEPEQETTKYLQLVSQLENQVIQTGLQSPEAERSLRRLRLLSKRMVEENPFQVANKSGVLAKVKNRIRDRMREESATDAFAQFWSQQHLTANWQQEISFFNTQIRPLIATNYYRPIGESGDFVDYFFLLDLPFVALFAMEFLARTYVLRQRHAGVRWIDTMLWRWYDILLLIPAWRWVRILPVTIRLHQSELIHLGRIRNEFYRNLATGLAGELSEIIVVQTIDQVQAAVKRGDITNILFRSQTRRPYVDLNNVNEVEAITRHLVNMTVYGVMPKVKPELEAVLRHGILGALKQMPGYQGLEQIPGLGQLPAQVIERVVAEATQTAYQTLISSLEDKEGIALTNQLVQKAAASLEAQLRDPDNIKHLQNLVFDLLEEMKINYVKNLSEADLVAIAEETRQLRLRG